MLLRTYVHICSYYTSFGTYRRNVKEVSKPWFPHSKISYSARVCIRSLVLIHYSRTLVTSRRRRRRRLLSTRNACVHEASYIIARRQARPLLALDVEDLPRLMHLPLTTVSYFVEYPLSGIVFYRYRDGSAILPTSRPTYIHARLEHLLIFDEMCFNYIELSALGMFKSTAIFFATNSRASYFGTGCHYLLAFFFFFFFCISCNIFFWKFFLFYIAYLDGSLRRIYARIYASDHLLVFLRVSVSFFVSYVTGFTKRTLCIDEVKMNLCTKVFDHWSCSFLMCFSCTEFLRTLTVQL